MDNNSPLPARPRTLSGSLIVLVILAASAGWGASSTANPAHADVPSPTAPEPTVTWSASPASESGPDGRAWMVLEAEPGETITEHLAVRNLGVAEVTFALSSADGYFTPTGRFNMLPRESESVDAGTWIEVQETVTVAPNGIAVVPVSIAVPDNATPGDHAAGLAASIVSAGSGDGTTMGVESRVGFRVMTRVSGEINAKLSVVEATGGYDWSWNPFRPGSVTLGYELENTGNVQLSVAGHTGAASGDADADGDDGGSGAEFTDTGATEAELLPGDRRSFEIEVADVWPLGMLNLTLGIDQAMVSHDGASDPLPTLEQNVVVWAIPWPQLTSLFALALILGGVLLGHRHNQKRVRTLVENARLEGAQEGLRRSNTAGSAHTIQAAER